MKLLVFHPSKHVHILKTERFPLVKCETNNFPCAHKHEEKRSSLYVEFYLSVPCIRMYVTWSFLWLVWFTVHWKFLSSLWHFTPESSCGHLQVSVALTVQHCSAVISAESHRPPRRFHLFVFLLWKRNPWQHQRLSLQV